LLQLVLFYIICSAAASLFLVKLVGASSLTFAETTIFLASLSAYLFSLSSILSFVS
jgi:hypothetical protein